MKTRLVSSVKLRSCHRSVCQDHKRDEKPYKVAEAVEEQQAAPASCLLWTVPQQVELWRAPTTWKGC